MTVTRLAIVGAGKIARDQHLPTIAASPDFELVAAVTDSGALDGVPNFPTIREMAIAVEADAVSICTPPRGRLALVREALDLGLDVMIEKPPAATLNEADTFATLAAHAGRVLYATWHSREAAGVEPARHWLEGKRIFQVSCSWKEDVRVWHPGQAWIWEPGIGVFDPGINALSVLTRILPAPLLLQAAELRFPSNRDAPIAAALDYMHERAPVRVELDFDQRGPQTWDIHVETDAGTLTLSLGGSRLVLNGSPVDVGDRPEYAALYRRFAELRARHESDFDLEPFRHVADAFLLGRRIATTPFED